MTTFLITIEAELDDQTEAQFAEDLRVTLEKAGYYQPNIRVLADADKAMEDYDG